MNWPIWRNQTPGSDHCTSAGTGRANQFRRFAIIHLSDVSRRHPVLPCSSDPGIAADVRHAKLAGEQISG
jgi:hypothetical protein